MNDALDVIAPELVSEFFRELFEIFQQTPIDALVRLNIAATLTPELAGINRLRSKFSEPVGNFIKLNQSFKDALAFATVFINALEPGIKPQTSWRVDKEEGNDVLIPDEPMYFVSRRHVISFADVNDGNWRTSFIEWTERIDAFKPACPPPRRRAKDVPNIWRSIKRCRASPEKISRSAVAERFN
jgi:hypothetical protein